MKVDRGLTVERMVELGRREPRRLLPIRSGPASAAKIADMDLRDAIQRIALEWPSYGRPRITAELRRQGLSAPG